MKAEWNSGFLALSSGSRLAASLNLTIAFCWVCTSIGSSSSILRSSSTRGQVDNSTCRRKKNVVENTAPHALQLHVPATECFIGSNFGPLRVSLESGCCFILCRRSAPEPWKTAPQSSHAMRCSCTDMGIYSALMFLSTMCRRRALGR